MSTHRLTTTALVMTGALIAVLTLVIAAPAAAAPATYKIDPDHPSFEADHLAGLGQKQLERWAVGPQFFDAKKHPRARYQGRLDGFVNGAPTQVVGELTPLTPSP